MGAYEALAGVYDTLTWDVDYDRRVDYLETLFEKSRRPVRTVLDLACGTGEITKLLTQRGYELIAVDNSPDMLAAARRKTEELSGEKPMFVNQSMPELDLYGTVDAAVCCLDSINYLQKSKDVRKTFARLHLFIAPGGLLVFDVSTPAKLRAMDGQVFLDEKENVYCVWRATYERRRALCFYGVDLFLRRANGTWDRRGEEHCQRAYPMGQLRRWLREAGFGRIRLYGDCSVSPPDPGEQRVFFCAIRE